MEAYNCLNTPITKIKCMGNNYSFINIFEEVWAGGDSNQRPLTL